MGILSQVEVWVNCTRCNAELVIDQSSRGEWQGHQGRLGVVVFVEPHHECRPVTIKRVDPEGCGCTDCLVGEFSKPFNELFDHEREALEHGRIQDATGRVST